jgi:hypothetical protein
MMLLRTTHRSAQQRLHRVYEPCRKTRLDVSLLGEEGLSPLSRPDACLPRTTGPAARHSISFGPGPQQRKSSDGRERSSSRNVNGTSPPATKPPNDRVGLPATLSRPAPPWGSGGRRWQAQGLHARSRGELNPLPVYGRRRGTAAAARPQFFLPPRGAVSAPSRRCPPTASCQPVRAPSFGASPRDVDDLSGSSPIATAPLSFVGIQAKAGVRIDRTAALG